MSSKVLAMLSIMVEVECVKIRQRSAAAKACYPLVCVILHINCLLRLSPAMSVFMVSFMP
eukprot:SAG31_NODE_3642_length_4032_cov_1.536232_2_plen_60_part_00